MESKGFKQKKVYSIDDGIGVARSPLVLQIYSPTEDSLMESLHPTDLHDFKHDLFDNARQAQGAIEIKVREGLVQGLQVHEIAEEINATMLEFVRRRHNLYEKYLKKKLS